MNIVLWGTGCPKCVILKEKLKSERIKYVENNDVDKMLELGIQTVPVLEVNGELLDFASAVKWINEVNN